MKHAFPRNSSVHLFLQPCQRNVRLRKRLRVNRAFSVRGERRVGQQPRLCHGAAAAPLAPGGAGLNLRDWVALAPRGCFVPEILVSCRKTDTVRQQLYNICSCVLFPISKFGTLLLRFYGRRSLPYVYDTATPIHWPHIPGATTLFHISYLSFAEGAQEMEGH